MGIGLLVGIWVARYLGPERFGLLSFASAFTGSFAVIATLGLQGIVVRNIIQDPPCRNKTLGTATALQFVAGLIVYAIMLLVIFYLRSDDTLSRLIVAILGSSILFKFSEVAIYWFESQVLSKYIVWVKNIAFLVFAVIKFSMVLYEAPLIKFAWALLGETMLAAILAVCAMRSHGPRIKELKISINKAKELIQDSWPLLVSSVAIILYTKIDQIMIGQMLGDEAVGIYTAAVRISEIFYFIPMVVAASVFPTILDAKTQSEKFYIGRIQRLYSLLACISISVALPMTFIATPLVTLLFGSAYLGAGPILTIHIWGLIFVCLGVVSGQWHLAENRQLLGMQRAVAGAVANISLNLILIPHYGLIGAASATVISYAIAGLLLDLIQKETRNMFFLKLQSMNPLLIIKILCGK